MCGSMADIQSAAAEIRRGNKKRRRRKKNKPQHENIYGLPITYCDHKLYMDFREILGIGRRGIRKEWIEFWK